MKIESYIINIYKCYHIFKTSTSEFLLSFNKEKMNKRFFIFKLIVEENSIVQL